MARPQKFRHSVEALNDPQIAEKLGRLVLDIENLRMKREQIDTQIAAAFDAVDDAGFDKKFVRKVVSLRAKDGDARRDEEAGIEAYEFAVEKGVSLASARRKRENVDPETGEVLDDRRSDLGLNIQTKHTDIRSGGLSPAPSGLTTRPAEESVVPHSPETATECAAPERDAAADERSVEAAGGAALVRTFPDQPREGGNNAQQVRQHVVSDRRRHSQSEENTEKPQTAEQAGGEHEVATGNAERVPTSNTGEGAANTALPAKSSIRPLCRNPGETCGGYGRKHCRACEMAATELEEVA